MERIGRYEIRREIGRGGMATVFIAFDPRIRRQVAIKVLPRQFTHDPKYLARFQQEAQTVATLEHPAIVPIHDFGEHQDAPYLVMRYMSGGSLRDRLKGRPLTLEQIAPVLERLAPGLDYAHEAGIVHRDLKPANILFDDQGNAYLADFGIARLAEASQTMTIIGTPAYMSPEQVESELQLDGRSDIYAMGVILYELLTGKPPYTAETPTGQMLMHITKPIPKILEANRDLPPQTQQVIEKAMAKDREERYQSLAELAAAVKGLVALETTDGAEAAPDSVVDDLPGGSSPTSMEPGSDSAGSDDSEERAPQAPSEPVIESELEAEPSADAAAAAESGAAQPMEAASKNRLPGWVWWAGALALLAIVIFGLRSIFIGGNGGEPREPAADAVEATPAVSEEKPTAVVAIESLDRDGGGTAEVGSLEPTPPTDSNSRRGETVEEAPVEPTATAKARPTESPTLLPELSSQVHVVEPGETLFQIAVQYGLTIDQLLSANGMTDQSQLSVGQALILPEEGAGLQQPGEATNSQTPPIDAELGDTWVRPADGMTMVYVPAGSFTMGSDASEMNQRPAHEVLLDAYWIDRTEVTNEQFMEFTAASGYETSAEKIGFSNVTIPSNWVATEGADWRHPQGSGSGLEDLEGYPVFHMSWVDADAYCSWAGARLPTEAEWEYAARGPESLIYPWGDDFDGEKANWCDASCRMRWANSAANDGHAGLAPAGNYLAGASWVGALDMAGNLWEWVKDWYASDYYANAPKDNPQGPASGDLKLLRGGSFDSQLFQLRGAYRLGGDPPETSYDGYGFRCVLNPGG